GYDDLAGTRIGESQKWDVEAGPRPDLPDLRIVYIELGEAEHLEPQAPSSGLLMEEADLLADPGPVLGRLAVIDAPELERSEPVVFGGVADVEAWVAHTESVARKRTFLTLRLCPRTSE